MEKQDTWVSRLRDLVRFLDSHHRVEGHRQGLAAGETMIGGTPEYHVDTLPSFEAIKLEKMAGGLVAEMGRLELDSAALASPTRKAYAAMLELHRHAVGFKQDHDIGASSTCLILPKRVEEYRSLLLICPTCGGSGAVFVQQPTGLDDPNMEYVREPCPGPNMGRDGVLCLHGAMESDRVGSVSFAADPDIVFDDERIHATLADGRRVSVPLSIASPPLATATDEQRRNFEVYRNGIHWPDVDDDIMAETFGGAPSSVFPDSTLGAMVEAARVALETVDVSVRDKCGPLLRRVCDCNCHGFVLAIPTAVSCGDGRECVVTPANACVKCGQRRGSV